MKATTAVALAIAACATPFVATTTLAQPSASAAQKGDPRQFDIAGVMIGMSPVEARAALKARGYAVGADNTDKSDYHALLTKKLREREPSLPYASEGIHIRHFSGEGPAGEQVIVSFSETPSGNRVSEVSLSLNSNRIDASRMRGDVMAKYGKPTIARDSLGSTWWCRSSETRCDRVGYTDTVLEFSDVAGVTLRLVDDNRMRRETDTAIAAEVERRYPRRAANF
ncbi:hypothetical protein [Erythrobacter sp. R86502]|uniref:hypothetical protein n=1 Tax=Erythrobacter sp. R86502 TaxID=3093846 RepID=UPI0036D40A70